MSIELRYTAIDLGNNEFRDMDTVIANDPGYVRSKYSNKFRNP